MVRQPGTHFGVVILAPSLAALAALGCGSYDESSGLIDGGGVIEATGLRINELMPRNSGTLPDEQGEYDDWIEIHNTKDRDASLGGYFVSDSADTPYECLLPGDVVVPAQGFLVLWADGAPEQGDLHLDFRLSRDGDGVWLTSPDGTPVDSVTFGPPASAQISYSWYPDGNGGGAWEWCASPTPGASNGDSCD